MMRKITLLLAFAFLLTFNVTAQQVGQGFTSINNLTPEATSTSTGEKPQSKPWKYDGKWWAVFPNSSGTHLWRLDGTKWTNILRLSTRTTSKADCKVVGDITHILLYQGASSQMASVEYAPETGTYRLWSKRTSTVGLTLDRGVETATIDIDSRGRMWMASAGVSDINVRWSDSPYNTWSSPITIASGVTDDDICAVIAMPGKIGVLWSNQNTKRFGFKTHEDGASPSSWSADEVPASQSAQNVGNGMADDHLNMAVASDGTLYCAVKTEYGTSGYPEIALLVRRPAGTWHNLYEVDEIGTRPIVILNESLGRLKVIYTSGNNGGNILYKETSTTSIAFGARLTLISGTYNNPTSSKDNYSSDVVVLASNSSNVVGVLAVDGTVTTPTAPAAPLLASPANGATGVSVSPTLGWIASSGAASYQVQVSTSSGFASLTYNKSGIATTFASVSGLAAGTDYFWRVRASNAGGTSDWSEVWAFATESTPTTPPPAGTLVGHWKLDEGSGSALADASGLGNKATAFGSPTWVSGVSGSALHLSGKGQYATAPDAASLDITGNITLAAWIKPEARANQYVLHKAKNNTANGYEISLTSAGLILFRFNQASSGETYRVNAAETYPSDGSTWVHVAATYDGTTARIYVNGTESKNKSFSSPPPIGANNLPFAIGAQHDGFRPFKGSIDEARVYNKALTAQEVKDLASGLTPETPSVPATPLLVSPATNSTGISLSPNLSWQASSGAETYQVQVSTSSNFSSTAFDRSSISTTSTQASGLSAGIVYYWRVRASNSAGTSAWSTTWNFRTLQETTDTYTLTINQAAGGTIAANPSQASYAAGSTVSLTATPASGYRFVNWTGDASGSQNPVSITMTANKSVSAVFETTSTEGQQVTGFTLVAANTDTDIGPVVDGQILNLDELPSTKLTIRANTNPAVVGSVRLELSGPQSRNYVDSNTPYSLFGDDGAANYYFGTWGPPTTGTYTLKATPYVEAGAKGAAGTPLTITFTFTSTSLASTSSSSLQGAALPEGSFVAYPNPFSTKAIVNFSLAEGGEYSLILFDSRGAQVTTIRQGKAAAGEMNSVEVNGSDLPKGLYFVRLQAKDKIQTLKLILDK